MGLYSKLPVIDEAFQWTGGINQQEDPLWIIEAVQKGMVWFKNVGTEQCQMGIAGQSGIHVAEIGDYIIQGVQGEIYPCKADVFAETYVEIVEDSVVLKLYYRLGNNTREMLIDVFEYTTRDALSSVLEKINDGREFVAFHTKKNEWILIKTNDIILITTV